MHPNDRANRLLAGHAASRALAARCGGPVPPHMRVRVEFAGLIHCWEGCGGLDSCCPSCGGYARPQNLMEVSRG